MGDKIYVASLRVVRLADGEAVVETFVNDREPVGLVALVDGNLVLVGKVVLFRLLRVVTGGRSEEGFAEFTAEVVGHPEFTFPGLPARVRVGDELRLSLPVCRVEKEEHVFSKVALRQAEDVATVRCECGAKTLFDFNAPGVRNVS